MRSRYLGGFARPNILPLAIATAWLLAGPAPSRAFDGGQSHPEPLRFEVASVKPAGPYVRGTGINGPGTGDPGRWIFPRSTLGNLLISAYDVLPDQIEGPAWLTDINSYVYSVAVTMDPKTTREQFRSMLQELLAERFHLRLHHETRTRPGYELVTARGGTKMTEWAPPTDGAPSRNSGAVAGFPQLAATGTGLAMQVRQLGMPVQIHMRDSMAALCRMLGTQISLSNGDPMMGPQPRVVDRTGLPGIYEFTLEYATAASSSAAMSASPAGGEPTAAATIEPTGSAVPIFTALEQQLGLKLNKVKAVAVDVLVIDHAERVPTEN